MVGAKARGWGRRREWDKREDEGGVGVTVRALLKPRLLRHPYFCRPPLRRLPPLPLSLQLRAKPRTEGLAFLGRHLELRAGSFVCRLLALECTPSLLTDLLDLPLTPPCRRCKLLQAKERRCSAAIQCTVIQTTYRRRCSASTWWACLRLVTV